MKLLISIIPARFIFSAFKKTKKNQNLLQRDTKWYAFGEDWYLYGI